MNEVPSSPPQNTLADVPQGEACRHPSYTTGNIPMLRTTVASPSVVRLDTGQPLDIPLTDVVIYAPDAEFELFPSST